MSDITDLNPLSPTGNDPVSDGDNELRALKNALVGDGTAAQGSFTPSFTGQYTGTATELNAVNTAIQPTDDLDALNDVTYSPDPPAVGDHLVYGAGGWANETPAPPDERPKAARFSGYAGSVGSQVYFTNEDNNDIPSSLVTFKNDGADGFGFTLTANEDIVFNLSWYVLGEWQGEDGGSSPTRYAANGLINLTTGVGRNTVGTSMDQSIQGGGNQIAFNSYTVTAATSYFPARGIAKVGVTTSADASLDDGDFLTISLDAEKVITGYSTDPAVSYTELILTVSVQPA